MILHIYSIKKTKKGCIRWVSIRSQTGFQTFFISLQQQKHFYTTYLSILPTVPEGSIKPKALIGPISPYVQDQSLIGRLRSHDPEHQLIVGFCVRRR